MSKVIFLEEYREFLENVIGPKSASDFASWAVGENFSKLQAHDWPKAWNSRHGDLTLINEYGEITDDLQLMIKLWKKHARTVN